MSSFTISLPSLPSTQDLILLGVMLHLGAAIAKTVFVKPKQQAAIEQIDAKVDAALQTVGQILPVVQGNSRKLAVAVPAPPPQNSYSPDPEDSTLSLNQIGNPQIGNPKIADGSQISSAPGGAL